MTEDLRLPVGTVLVHVGPHKTGTTAVQEGFFRTRRKHADHGVLYPGRGKQPYEEVQALLGHRGRLGSVIEDRAVWDRFAHSVRAAVDKRVVISCESLDHATPEQIALLVDELGGAQRLHVVRMMRRLDKLLPSQWQQSVVNGSVRGYDAWLHKVLEGASPGFWYGHGYARQAEEWVRALGADHVTLVVVDDAQPRGQLDVLERMTGLPNGFLPLGSATSNRSLTPTEVALVRGLSREVRARRWSPQAHYAVIRAGVKHAVKNLPVSPDEPKLGLPAWAVDKVVDRADREIDAVRRLGVRVVGDLETLRVVREQVRVSGPELLRLQPPVPVETVGVALVGLVDSARRRLGHHDLLMTPREAAAGVPLSRRSPSEWPVAQVSSKALLGVVAVRGVVRVVGTRLAERVLGRARVARSTQATKSGVGGPGWGALRERAPLRALSDLEERIVRAAVTEATRAGWDEAAIDRYVRRGALRALVRANDKRNRVGMEQAAATEGVGTGVPVRVAVAALLGATMATVSRRRARRLLARWTPASQAGLRTIVRELGKRARRRFRPSRGRRR